MPKSKNELSLGGPCNNVSTAGGRRQRFCELFKYYRMDGKKQMRLWPFLGNTSVNNRLFLIYRVPFQSKLLQTPVSIFVSFFDLFPHSAYAYVLKKPEHMITPFRQRAFEMAF